MKKTDEGMIVEINLDEQESQKAQSTADTLNIGLWLPFYFVAAVLLVAINISCSGHKCT